MLDLIQESKVRLSKLLFLNYLNISLIHYFYIEELSQTIINFDSSKLNKLVL